MTYTYKYLPGENIKGGQLDIKCDYVQRNDGTLVHKELNEEYLKWLAEGNTPEPADQPE